MRALMIEAAPGPAIPAGRSGSRRYRRTASYGHFGRVAEGPYFTWERTDRVDDLRSAAGLGRSGR